MSFEYDIEDVKAIQWAFKTDDPWDGKVNNFAITVQNIQNLHPNLLTNTYDFDSLAVKFKRNEITLGNIIHDKIRTKIYLIQNHIEILKSQKLKPFLNFRTHFRCCYCARDHIDEFTLDLDIEHILPKSVFSDCYFDLENLSIACKRCNMEIKKDDCSFLNHDLYKLSKLLNPSYRNYVKRKNVNHKYASKKEYFNSSLYSLIHPNLDKYSDHIKCRKLDFDEHRLTTYIILTDKGKYTYDYFNLKKFEVNSFENIQGIKREKMDAELLSFFESILKVN